MEQYPDLCLSPAIAAPVNVVVCLRRQVLLDRGDSFKAAPGG